MAGKQPTGGKKVHLFPPPPKDFDPFAATDKDLMRHGLPLRPDPQTQPGMAALWARQAARYRNFQHLEAQPDTTSAAKKPIAAPPSLGPDPTESCGYQLFNSAAPFTALFVTWTVPDLQFTPSPLGVDNFHTFVGLGFLDVHVEMTVDSAQNVTSQIWAQSIGNINLPVRPGDVISGSLCLQTNQAGTASYFLANETTAQTVNFSVDTGFPPAVTINAGVTRSWSLNQPFPPLARFGVVYFDEISAYTTSGPLSLTSGSAITMVDQNGKTLASPVRLTDFTFKTVFVSA
jgi:peptidase A4-like protein